MKRLQSKKIGLVFLLSLLYWSYLALTSRMDIIWDSINYEALGRLLQHQGWVEYFKTGPNREPLYPWLVSLSMNLGDATGFVYTKALAFFGVIILLISEFLIYRILCLLKVRESICILIMAYFTISPGINNAAFSLYSEIAAIPIILSIVLVSFYAWESVRQNKRSEALGFGALLGTLLTLATLVKAVFECIAPCYLLIFFILVLGKEKKRLSPLLLAILIAAGFFYLPITGYKWLNAHYNGHFAVTNRGAWALYGSTARRLEPLTPKRFAEALAFAPGEGVCNSIFGETECDFWSYKKSDELGHLKVDSLASQHLTSKETDAKLIKDSALLVVHNPFQYALLTALEGTKMFFWESTQIGFVQYPSWLTKIYNIKILSNALRFLLFVASFMAVLSLWFNKKLSPLASLMGVLIFLYILFFSFFFILTRYALPIAPLYLIAIGFWINYNVPHAKNN